MPEVAIPPIRVAVFAESIFQRTNLKRILEEYGITIIDGDLSTFEPEYVDKQRLDVILINVDENDESFDLIDHVVETAEIPVIFHDAIQVPTSNSEWSRKLVNKLLKLVYGEGAPKLEKTISTLPVATMNDFMDSAENEPHYDDEAEGDDEFHAPEMPSELVELFAEDKRRGLLHDDEEDVVESTEVPSGLTTTFPAPTRLLGPALWTEEVAQYVWVLGASLGGLQAIKQFLTEIPSNLPIAFVLALHIGKEHVDGLIDQLKLVTSLEVIIPTEGHVIRHHQLIVIPPDYRIEINQRGRVELFSTSAMEYLYSPSIDDVMIAIAVRYRTHSGGIIFTGMGHDGVKGSQAMLEQGGVIWCQSRESSVVSGMIDEINSLGIPSFSADPQRLAKHLIRVIQSKVTAKMREKDNE